MSSLHRPRFALLVFALVLALASPAPAGVLPVSPGDADRLVEVTSACPTFVWSAVEGAIAYEIAVLDVGDAENPLLVYSRRIEGAAFAWAPSREQCLAPDRVYAWLVRAGVAGSGLGEWSAPRRFRVPGVPSIEEVDAALALLERWRVAQPEAGARPGGAGGPQPSDRTSAGRDERATAAGDAPVLDGVAAIRGENPDTTGSAWGVLGLSSSPAGAGVVALNETNGPDLMLDGTAAGVPSALLSEKGIDRSSASPETFNIQNSGAGSMSLYVDGVAVTLAGHVHAGPDITTGVVADARIASTLARDSEVFGLVLAGDGPGSGLNADTLDGVHAAAVQERVTGSCPPGSALLAIHADGSVDCQEIPVPPRFTTLLASYEHVGIEETSMAILPDGSPVITFFDDNLLALRLVRCRDAACASGEETVTTIEDTDHVLGKYSAVAIGTDGYPVIGYYDETAQALKVAKCSTTTCGSRTITTLDDAADDLGTYVAIAIGGDGFPVLSYYNATDGTLKVAKCANASCTTSSLATVDDPPEDVGQWGSIATGTDGYPVIAYYDETSGALKVAKCNDYACAPGGETVTTVNNPVNDVGLCTSIAIGADGFPVVAYYDYSAESLKVARCNDAACAPGGETITTVDGTDVSVGGYASLAIGSDGFPVIAYYDNHTFALRVTKCDDAACAGFDETTTLLDDTLTIIVGYYPSIALGADGLPVVAYIDYSYKTIKVAKCANLSCRY